MPLWLFGCIFAAVGLVPMLLAFFFFSKDRAIKRWPKAPGKIVNSQVEEREVSSRDQHGYYRTWTAYSPEVHFTYTVGGVEHEGTKVARNIPGTNSYKKVKACVDRYPANSDVQVLCNPSDPTEAYLETRVSIGGIIFMIFGTIWMSIGLAMIAAALFG